MDDWATSGLEIGSAAPLVRARPMNEYLLKVRPLPAQRDSVLECHVGTHAETPFDQRKSCVQGAGR
jgi:hypothetical protein